VAFFYAPQLLGGGVPIAAAVGISPRPQGKKSASGAGKVALGIRLESLRVRRLGGDLLIEGDVRR